MSSLTRPVHRALARGVSHYTLSTVTRVASISTVRNLTTVPSRPQNPPGSTNANTSLTAYRSASSYVPHHGGFGGTPSYFSAPSLPANTIIRFVPQQTAWVVERMGKFHRILEPGLAILIPIIDKIKYVKTLKEVAIGIPSQSAITADNVTLELDGVLYIRIFDAYKASYGVEDAEYAISQLAQTTMRSEIGQLTLDHVLKERANLNTNITMAINEASQDWGVKVLRYEIRDIHAPEAVLHAMHRQVSAERSKRAEILESEGQRQAAINIAEGKKQSVILASEALKAEQINRAAGEAEAIRLRAEATAQGIEKVAAAIEAGADSAQNAVGLSVAEKYVDAFGKLAKESNTIVIPSAMGDVGGMIASAMGIYGKISEQQARNQMVLNATAVSEPEVTKEDKKSSSSNFKDVLLQEFDSAKDKDKEKEKKRKN
ncbi:Flotillin-1 [Drechslerella dactyloides]|uniref:Flotillin-1 n=1 Tax=Drechslerella dactyloides TaxID=74499 RepID=A0AAD6IYQ2_DREDA|nr:Flotillin-1 [Drechslerella dactyloides]